MNPPTLNIRIGTMVPGAIAADYIRQIKPLGFESFELSFGPTLGGVDLAAIASGVKEAIGDDDIVISAIGLYGNPLESDENGIQGAKDWETMIDSAHLFSAGVVAGFTGRLRGKPLPDSIPRFKEIFAPLARRAEDKGVKIAFENCDMGGTWQSGDHNIAHTPAAWQLMFDAVPSPALGLEWEPCHQMVKLIDPMPQLRKWAGRIHHIHGKDATVLMDVVREHGVFGAEPFAFHRTPGFGDSDWTAIISELRRAGFRGSIDIEGWHDPVYVGELEMTGQVHALNYLKGCRGGDFVPNPKV